MTDLPDSLAEDFQYWLKTQGYFVLEEAVSDDLLLDRLSAAIDRSLQKHDGNFSDISHLIVNRDAAFLELLDQTGPIELMETILGDTCIIHSYNCVSLHPGRSNNAGQLHKDSQRFSPDYIHALQVLWFIDDFTAENGATWFLPGSHHSGARPTEEQFDARAVQVPGKRGAAVIFDSGVWHRSGQNFTDLPRRGITLVLSRAFMKQQIDLPRAADPRVASRAAPRLRRLLGFDARVPASLEEFNLPPAERLYKPNQG